MSLPLPVLSCDARGVYAGEKAIVCGGAVGVGYVWEADRSEEWACQVRLGLGLRQGVGMVGLMRLATRKTR